MGAGVSVETGSAPSDADGVRVAVARAAAMPPPVDDLTNLCRVTWGTDWESLGDDVTEARRLVAAEILGGAPAGESARARAGDIDAMRQTTTATEIKRQMLANPEPCTLRGLDYRNEEDLLVSSLGASSIASFATETSTARRESFSARSASSLSAAAPCPMVALLQAAPLVHQGQPVDLLDLKAERDAIVAALARAGRRIKLACDFCTTRRLRSLLTEGCRLLHYSGHGFAYTTPEGHQRAWLAFEDGLGGTHALEVDKLTDLVRAGADGEVEADDAAGGAQPPPLDCVFVSACHSDQAGQAFVAAGVPHVVAVRREAQLQDKAACAFADQFYYAAFRGKTVQQAFDIAKQAVSNDPSIKHAERESHKFLLLPPHGNHHVALFAKESPEGPLLDGTPSPALCNLPAFFPLQFVGRQLEWQQLVAAAAGQEKRVMLLMGAPGMGTTSLALAAAQYAYERSVFPGGVLYVQAKGATNASELCAMVQAALQEARTGQAWAEEEGYAEDDADAPPRTAAPSAPPEAMAMLASVLRRLGRCLILIDHLELGPAVPQSSREAMVSLLQHALNKAPDLRLLLTSREPIVLPGVATRQIGLSPLPAREAARLFRSLCPRPITRAELRCDDPATLKAEMVDLLRELALKLPGLESFELRSLPDQPLRVQWRLPSLAAAAALHRELSATPTRLQLDVPPLSASGIAALVGFLSLPKMLASHPVLAALGGNPKALSLAVSLLLPETVRPRSMDEAAELLQPLLAAAKVSAC